MIEVSTRKMEVCRTEKDSLGQKKMKHISLSSMISFMTSLTFSDYVKTTYLALTLSPSMTQGQYVAYFCCLLISGKHFKKVDSAPLRICKLLDDNDRAKFYRGDRELTKEDAIYIYKNWTDTYLVEKIMGSPTEARYAMFDTFEVLGIEFPDDNEESKAQVIADNLRNLLYEMSQRKNKRTSRPIGFSIEDVDAPCYYSQEKGVLIIGKRKVKIDPIIAPTRVEPSEEERQYIKEMLKVFAEFLRVEVDSIRELKLADCDLYKELISNRECFYSAESIRHIVRDAFQDGDEYFDSYKEELFEGIVVVHHRTYPDGYERMQAVLDKSTSMNLNRQKLERLYIVGAKEKKGICHMLVDEGKIISWMKRF